MTPCYAEVTMTAAHRYQALDSLRGIAALSVAVFHLQVASHIYFFTLTRHAYMFVDFFFVLSGFVISHAYASRLNTARDLVPFAIRRFGRIYPLHFVMLAVFVAFELAVLVISHHAPGALPRPPFSEDRTPMAILVNLLLLNGVGIYEGSTWNGPSWSISAEFFTYLIFAITVVLARRRLPLVALVYVVAAGLSLYLLAPKFLATSSQFGLERCVYGFFAGHLVWCLRNRPLPIKGTLAEVLAIVLVLGFVYLAEVGPLQLLAPVVFGIAILVFSRQDGHVSQALLRPFPRKLGDLSYSIYMVHFFGAFLTNNVLRAAGKLLHKPTTLPGTDLALVGNAWVMDGVTLAFLAAVVLVATQTYRFIEMPGMNQFGKWANRFKVGGSDRFPARSTEKTFVSD
ncbi:MULTISPECIES: acyltransferase family protein [unclassified Sphingomonas]|uniref:acyltransferase family protein n=1 Tax=Novosphingobium rhizosphaerae TaxID=1551649 RepID=UPI0015CA8046